MVSVSTVALVPKGGGVVTVPVDISVDILVPWRHPASTCVNTHYSSSIMDLEVQAGHGAMVDPLRLWSTKHYARPPVCFGVEDAPVGGELLQAVVGASLLVLLPELGPGSVVVCLRRRSRIRSKFGKKATPTSSRVFQAGRGAVKAVIVAACPGEHGVTVGVQSALEGCSSGYRGAVVVDGWLVHGSSVEGQAADHRTGLEDRAWTGGQAYAGVMGRCAQAVVVIVEGQGRGLATSSALLVGFVVVEEEMGGRRGDGSGGRS